MYAGAFRRGAGRLTPAGNGSTEPAARVVDAYRSTFAFVGSRAGFGDALRPFRQASGCAGGIGDLAGGAGLDRRARRRCERVAVVDRKANERSGVHRLSRQLHLERQKAMLLGRATRPISATAQFAASAAGANGSHPAVAPRLAGAVERRRTYGLTSRGDPVARRGGASHVGWAAHARLVVAGSHRTKRRAARWRCCLATSVENRTRWIASRSSARCSAVGGRAIRRRASGADEGPPKSQKESDVPGSSHAPHSTRAPHRLLPFFGGCSGVQRFGHDGRNISIDTPASSQSRSVEAGTYRLDWTRDSQPLPPPHAIFSKVSRG
jgi:hypothetical protein